MKTNIASRRVRMFRCQIPPLFGPKPNNAHMPETYGAEAWVDDSSQGVVVLTKGDGGHREHFVPFTNIQHIEFYPEVAEEKKPKLKSQAV